MEIAPKHDFAAKLRQESIVSRVIDYVEWQRRVRSARDSGTESPEMPHIGLVSINLDLTTACNYRCGHCIDWDKLNTGVNYAEDELFSSLREMIKDGLKSVILIGGGEPTLHRKFVDVVHLLKNHSVKIGIVTNGSRGDMLEKVAPILTEGDWIRLSLDSGRNETFIKMHEPRSKAVSLEAICSWIPKIRKANPRIQVGFSFIIVWDGAERSEGSGVVSNISEIVEASKLARDSGFTYISFKPFLTRFSDGAEVIDTSVMSDRAATLARITAAILEAKKLEAGEFKVLESTNLRVLMAGNWEAFTKQPKTCHMMAFREVVSPLGIYHCPAKRGVAHARVSNGNGYLPLYKLETRRSLRAMLEKFDASVECREITCLYNAVNWWLEGLITGTEAPEIVALRDSGDYYL